ncbi:MAG TPA: sigma-54-dependent Fis family transcriptional regulator, partial [Chitinophagaceae bacterium]|nr:sigma-54-dependent Fis family transcriptional regulator [Chitinophagaceae bacterium]
KRRSRNPALKSYLDLEYPVLDDSIESSNYPIVYNVQSLLPYGGDQMAFMDDAGIKEFAVLKLIEGNQLIGLLILLSEKLNSFSKDNLDLLHRISYQISIATANIIANEEIVKREEEKTILLSLSTEIAAVKNKKELSQLLNAKLIHLFSITGFGITLLNEDKKTHSPFVVDANDDLRNDPDFKKVIALNYSVRDGVFNNIIDAEEPVTLYVKDLVCMSEAPAYVNFWQKMGVIQVVGIPVRAGEKKLGCFILLQNPKAFTSLSNNLIKGVCAQISVAISNIIAIEINAKREYEKTILLSLSFEIAALRNRNDLFKMVNAELKDLFLIKEFGIAQINEDKKTYSAFILELEDHIKSLPGYNEITSDKYDVNDPVFSRIMKSDEPVLFPVNELAEVAGIPAYVGFWKKAGVHEVLCVALKAGGANIGCAFLHTSEQTMNNLNNNLLKGVCAHLSVAVSNILTNEKNSNQLIEINRYKQQLEAEKTYLKAEIETIQNYAEIIGGAPEMKKVFRLVSQVASSSSSVLLLGETGTGKELIARAIHNSSPRKNKLMVKVNCAALPANLIESELFGHERGSFTGATERRLGKFELANNGTLFLDEIGEMPLELQVKLLRAIQEREIERVGGSVTIKVDVRIITATNR